MNLIQMVVIEMNYQYLTLKRKLAEVLITLAWTEDLQPWSALVNHIHIYILATIDPMNAKPLAAYTMFSNSITVDLKEGN
jgi:hypothetical protein